MQQKQTTAPGGRHRTRKKAKVRIRKGRFALACIIMISFVFLIVFCVHEITSDNNWLLPDNTIDDSQPEVPSVHAVVPDAESLPINSANAVLMDLNGAILFDKNASAKMYPASLTKIMTAVIALEHITDLHEEVLLNHSIFAPLYREHASMAGFLPDETVRAIDLLYGLLLPSGGECAVGLAEHVAGSESAFAGLMNDKARELGMSDSNFTNATGLPDHNQYSTAMDMAVLFRYALADPTFYKMITSTSHTSSSTNLHENGITYDSTLFSNMTSSDFDGCSILGGKTGYTEIAGQCLASLAEKKGNRYILVTSGAQGDNKLQNLHIDDAVTVYSAIVEIEGDV